MGRRPPPLVSGRISSRQPIGAYTTPSLSISSPARPVKPTICQPAGAVKVTASEVAVPADRVRPVSVVKAAEKIRVRPSFWPWRQLDGGEVLAGARVREAAVPPVPPWVRAVPPSRVRDTASRREPPRRVSVRGDGRRPGRSSASLKAVPCGPPNVVARRAASAAASRRSRPCAGSGRRGCSPAESRNAAHSLL